MASHSSASDRGGRVTSPPLSRALRAVTPVFFGSRVAVLAIGAAAILLFGYPSFSPGSPQAWRMSADPLRNLLARWDTFWYHSIATNGYQWNGDVHLQQNVVFFPLYPSLMRVGGWMLGGRPIAAGLVVSFSAGLLAFAYFWRWCAARADADTAAAAVMLMCAFPYALFYSAVYTESLFLLTVIGAFWHAERRELAAAAAFALACGLTRPNGFTLAVPLAWLLLVRPRGEVASSIGARVAVVAAPVAGMLIYACYLQMTVGAPWAWISGQAAWGTGPWRDVPNPWGAVPPVIPVANVVVETGNALSLLFALAGMVALTRMAGVAYGLWVAASLLPAVVRHGTVSLGRFTSVLFPLFFWLATRVPRARRWQVVSAFAAGQALLAAWFFLWRDVT